MTAAMTGSALSDYGKEVVRLGWWFWSRMYIRLQRLADVSEVSKEWNDGEARYVE